MCICLLACRGNGFNEYKPVYESKSGGFIKIDSYSIIHKEKIKQVFLYYGVEVKEINGRVFYKGNVDDELLWNYTRKANDSSWLSSHQ